jgi:hypothetical protein
MSGDRDAHPVIRCVERVAVQDAEESDAEESIER